MLRSVVRLEAGICAAIALVVATTVGCGRTWDYDVAVRNETGVTVEDVRVLFSGLEYHVGVLIPGGEATWRRIHLPLEPKIVVEWRVPGGTGTSNAIDVSHLLANGIQNRRLLLVIRGSKVDLKVEETPELTLKGLPGNS